MDTNIALLSTGTGGTILGVLFLMYRTFNHKRCRSKCCGQDLDLSLDIENTTPPRQNFVVNNPLPPRPVTPDFV
jgi:hypothetical protein